MSLRELSLAAFAEEVASTSPVPGGGSASAVPAAVAAGLVAMVARQSAAGDPFGDLAWDMDAIANEADALRAELLGLVEDDVRAFDDVIASLREGEPSQAAFRAAVDPPMRVCLRSLRVLELAADVAARGNPNASSDAGVAALLAAASLEAGALTVRNDLRPVDDEAFRAACAEEMRAALARGRALRESALTGDLGSP